MSTKMKRAELRKRFGPGVTAEEMERGYGSPLKGDVVLVRDMPNGDKVGGGALSIVVINNKEGFLRVANIYLPDGPLGGHFGRNYTATGSYVVPLEDTKEGREEQVAKYLDPKQTKRNPYKVAHGRATFNGLVERTNTGKSAKKAKKAEQVEEIDVHTPQSVA